MRQPTEDEIEDARIDRLEERARWASVHAPWCMSRMGGVMPCDCRDKVDEEDEEDADDV